MPLNSEDKSQGYSLIFQKIDGLCTVLEMLCYEVM